MLALGSSRVTQFKVFNFSSIPTKSTILGVPISLALNERWDFRRRLRDRKLSIRFNQDLAPSLKRSLLDLFCSGIGDISSFGQYSFVKSLDKSMGDIRDHRRDCR